MKTIILTLSLSAILFTGASVAKVSRGSKLPEPTITAPDGAFYVDPMLQRPSCGPELPRLPVARHSARRRRCPLTASQRFIRHRRRSSGRYY